MTVAELKEFLEDFDDDMEVCIGMQQRIGSDWAYSVSDVNAFDVRNLDTSDKEEHVVISMGRQFGTVRYDD